MGTAAGPMFKPDGTPNPTPDWVVGVCLDFDGDDERLKTPLTVRTADCTRDCIRVPNDFKLKPPLAVVDLLEPAEQKII